MIVRTKTPSDTRHPSSVKPRPALRRRAMCQFIALALFGGAAHAATPPAFSPGWFATKQPGATQPATPSQGGGAAGNGGNVFTPGNVMLQQRVQQSIANLDAAAQAVAAQMSAQKSAQAAAQALASNVPDGLGKGGLQVDSHAGTDPSLWQNANAPTQSVASGQTTVQIKQNAPKAIMTWETFNVGRHTTVHFDQTGGTRTDGSNQWIALNRVNDPSGKPSEILGQIKAEGTVYLLNRNGMIFGGGAQVDTHSLIASSLDLFSTDVSKSNAFFLKSGIGATQDNENILGDQGSVTGFLVSAAVYGRTEDPRGVIAIENGASLNATKDGFVIVAAPAIQQGGRVTADDGQAIFAAVPGLAAQASSATGALAVAPVIGLLSEPLQGVTNTGLVQARRGSIQWFGNTMEQDGVLVTSTSLSHPGSVSFVGLNGASGPLVFGSRSVTTVLPEKDGETTTSSSSADDAFVTSRVDVGLKAVMRSGALMEVPAGHVTFSRDAYIDDGAIIDVSGLANVTLPMSALLVTIPRIGLNELANSPLLRNSFLYTAKDVTVDTSRSGTRADGLDWVGSPVLNVAGYVSNVPRDIQQLMINAGTIAFQNNAVIRTGAQLRLEGGFINYLPGYVQTPRLQGANGLIYDIAAADPDVQYAGFAGVYDSVHARWGVTETFVSSPLLANMKRWDPGFIKGGDAGTLSFGLSADNGQAYQFIIDGDVSAHVYAGREQVANGSEPLAGTLDIRSRDLASMSENANIGQSVSINYLIEDRRQPIQAFVPDFDEDSKLPARDGDPNDPDNPSYWLRLSTAMIDNAGFRRLKLSTPGTVLLKEGSTLHLADGGEVDIAGTSVDIQGTIVTHGGSITLGSRGQAGIKADNLPTFITVGSGGRLDTSGLWVNDTGRPADEIEGRAFIDGGSVTLSAWKGGELSTDITPDITVERGSVIDVSGGGYVGVDGRLAMDGDLPAGRGGDVTVATHTDDGLNTYGITAAPADLLGGTISLDGTLVGGGFSGGGTLTLHAPRIQVGGAPQDDDGAWTLYLDPAFFRGLGFSGYNLVADTDVVVAPGTSLDVRPAYMVADRSALLTLGSRTSLLQSGGDGAVGIGEVGAYDNYLHRRDGDGISLQAGLYLKWQAPNPGAIRKYADYTGSVVIGDGARVDVGAGDTIALDGVGKVVVDGTLAARGGDIRLHNLGDGAHVVSEGRGVWLGADSVIDASGVSLLDPTAPALPGQGATPAAQRTGVVLGGGDIEMQSDAYVVAARGAAVDFSGANDTFDLPADGRRNGVASTVYQATPVWSDGGSFNLEAAKGLFFDASIDGHGGAGAARGGRFSLAARYPAEFAPGQNVPLFIQQSGWFAPVDVDPLALKDPGSPDDGNLRFAIDRLEGAGLDDVLIGRSFVDHDTTVKPASVVFAGDVALQASRSIQVQASTLTTAGADARAVPSAATVVTDGGNVTFSAPYVSLLGMETLSRPSAAAGDGSLTVNADFIDIGGRVSLSGIGNASFNSSGDVRFINPLSGTEAGWLYSTGDLDFTGTRVYPATDYHFLVDATNPSAKTTITFHQASSTDGTTPLSAGGVLAVGADTIEQQGTLWVPSGSLALGTDDPAATLAALGLDASVPLGVTGQVHLAPGSVTSVSLDGAVVPYGSTVDGKDWHYDVPNALADRLLTAPPEKSISIAGDNVAVDGGARVDLSGGGHVQASEWVPGTGGSRDVLSQYQTDFSQSTQGTQVPLYGDGRAVYAIVPGYHAPLSARDLALENGTGAGPAVGQGVYLSGMPGLPDGVYTLLPARYATLPGAFRVVQNTSVSDPVIGRAATAPDGTVVASGYFTDTLTGARDARSSSFLVQSAKVWGQYSEYSLTSADTFFADAAARAGDVAPQLGADAGRLTLAATSSLTLGATLDAAPATGGRGSQVDIAGDAIQVVGGAGVARDGYLHVDADDLSQLGAGSLLIGGKRSRESDGDRVAVIASDVLLSNDAAHALQGSEVILAATDNVTLDAGSSLRANASTDAPSPALLMGNLAADGSAATSGDGALVRVSGTDAAPIIRRNVTGLDGAAGAPGGNLTIGDGASLVSGQSISMDATGLTSIADKATLGAPSIDVTAGRIALSGRDPSTQDQAGRLLIGPHILAQLAGTDMTVLRGRSGIDLVGDVALGVSHALTLSTPEIVSDGGQAVLGAESIVLENDTGTLPGTVGAGGGHLRIDTGDLHTGHGDLSLGGLADIDVHASSGMFASGTGTLNTGTADFAAITPLVSVDNGAAAHWMGQGTFQLTGPAQGDVGDAEAAAGTLEIEAAAIDVGTRVAARGGKLSLHATTGDIHVNDGAVIDLSGLSLPFNDTTVNVPGGSLAMRADQGDIRVDTGADIDLRGGIKGGNGGRLDLRAESGVVALSGSLRGAAAAGYLGATMSIDSAGAFDLGSLAGAMAAGGVDGGVSVHTREGDLALAAGQTLRAHLVDLTADGGSIGIGGTIDASGTFGGSIDLFGARGVDIDGVLDTHASAQGRHGGDIQIGTSGTGNGSLNGQYGYQNVDAADAGHIRIGAGARIEQGGDTANGRLYLRAPLLSDGDTPVDIAGSASFAHTRDTTLEAYAIWDTRDAAVDPTKHFDGLVDPSGWFRVDPATGKAVLVDGVFTDSNGGTVTGPDPSDFAQVMDFLSRYTFTPAAINTDHATFYGYAGGDEAQGAGTLMGFVQSPGFTFESRLSAAPGLHVRPGIELRAGDDNGNAGTIDVLTPWNLGAGKRDANGDLDLVYRYQGQAPVLSLRAAGDVNVYASVTDGFFQDGNAGGGAGATPDMADWAAASAAWTTVLDLGNGIDGTPNAFDGSPLATPPVELTSGDPVAIAEYYGQYVAYATYLSSAIPGFDPYHPADVILTGLGLGYGILVPVTNPPAPPAPPTNMNSYVGYLAAYKAYLPQAITASDYLGSLGVPDNFQGLVAPPTTLDPINTSAPVDNSPSPHAVGTNPLPLLSASLTGGSSSSYRFVAGADLGSSDPLATMAGAVASLHLGGHTEYHDPITGKVLAAPTLVRTGTGDIDIVAASDVRWDDAKAPAAVYTAGEAADGTQTDTGASILRPSTNGNLTDSATPELVLSGAVNPVNAGRIGLHAGGDIVGLQDTVDTDGSLTGTAGASTAQYWWPWMQTTNSETRSSINFGAFSQGVMSAGGDVDVSAGGDIRQLSVSLPTTWTIATAGDGSRSLQTHGGGDLAVHAGGDILSGSYFVAKGQGSIQADGRIGADFSVNYTAPDGSRSTMPVSTLIALQDSQLDVQAGGSVSLGGIFNPSWLDSAAVNELAPAHHADGQSYSGSSRIDVSAYGGDLTYGDLTAPLQLMVAGISSLNSSTADTAGDILPATVNLIAANGSLDLKASGELFPSTDGNLGLLAKDSIRVDLPVTGLGWRYSWGLIDAPLSSMASPLNLASLVDSSTSAAAQVRTNGYLGVQLLSSPETQSYIHAAQPWHADDTQPVRMYALEGDIVNGSGGGFAGMLLTTSKETRVQAGRDIVDLAYMGQQLQASDISTIAAGRDIYDTPLTTADVDVSLSPARVFPVLVQAGPGYLYVKAGRDIGRLASQTEFFGLPSFVQDRYINRLQLPGSSSNVTGIDAVGNIYNPNLTRDGASIVVSYGVANGTDQAAFIARYVDPSAKKPGGLDDESRSLVSFVEGYDAGLPTSGGYTVEQAWQRFQQLPDEAKAIFVQQTLFRILKQVGKDYGDEGSTFAGMYSRGYDALNTLFPASLGYTANGMEGGTNGAANTISTGDLDIRGSTIQTQRGGDISIVAPGGQALLGSASAPPVVVGPNGKVLAGPNTQGILTLQQGDISIFTDRSTLLAQSRIFTEQGGDVVMWSSNGDINAGKGAKTNSEIPPVRYLCTVDAWCLQDPSGQVAGAGIATLQTVPDAPEGSVYLMAPRGTVDAGDAGIRVSGNLVIAAAHVANADNVQVKGDSVGLPVVQSVNVGALNAASSAASAATKAAEDVARQQQADSRDRLPSIISVQVIGANSGASVSPVGGNGYDPDSPVQVVRKGAGDGLTDSERSRLR
ncbi:filamentous hemagglutinin family protein [Luteibacter jiangsuensis]|uniref:Filamentous hemagglutinin family protein n=1 Tax=Luteibacter jiangsuensis TaxID=637577 RepID=A0ABT9SU47_9GAMM|nr:filamentous haemagglutinin family protein [Luteibacter jiangsuensis]MDQ0008521.1 filamentous hemagglutinin family protein [Luteibacter jiangsuensis]